MIDDIRGYIGIIKKGPTKTTENKLEHEKAAEVTPGQGEPESTQSVCLICSILIRQISNLNRQKKTCLNFDAKTRKKRCTKSF